MALRLGGIVLCGGLSKRMGRPKLELPFGPETLLQRVVRILIEVLEPVVVVAGPEQELPSLPGNVRIARDRQPGLGPLSGLATGLSELHQDCDAAFVTGCDTPLLKTEFIQRMCRELGDGDVAVCRQESYLHPLAAVYRTRLAEMAQAYVEQGRLRPGQLIQNCDARVIEVDALRTVDPELHSLRNLNTPEEYAGIGPGFRRFQPDGHRPRTSRCPHARIREPQFRGPGAAVD